MAEYEAYDYYKLKSDNLSDADIYRLGPHNVILPDVDSAYEKYGNNGDKLEFVKNYTDIKNKYNGFQNSAAHWEATDAANPYPWMLQSKEGEMLGGGPSGTNRIVNTEQEVAASKPIYNKWSTGEKDSDLKASEARLGTVALDYDSKGNPIYRFLKPGESTAGLTLNSVFGPSEQYSGAINKMMSGLWNGSVVSGISGAGAIVKNVGDLGEAMYNGVTTGEFTASGRNPFDSAYNNILGFSKGLQSVNEDQRGSLWYDFNNGLASLLTAMAVNMGAGKAANALGFKNAAAIGRNASLGVGSMQVMGDFTEQAKAAGIPDADIALMSPIMGAITWWSESKFGPDYVFNRYEQMGAKKLIQKEFIGELKEYAEKNGIKSMADMPKAGYAKAINNLAGKLGKAWNGLATGEGALYNFGKGAAGEGLEEYFEQIGQQGVQQIYDAFKVYHNNKLPADKQKVIDKNYGLFYGKDFSLGNIYDNVTEGAGYAALLGGLTGGVANLGGSLVNKHKQIDHQRRIINEAIISGKVDELKEAITEAYNKDASFPGASWTNGQDTVTYDINGNKTSKSIKDVVYEQIMSDIDLQNDLYQKSGIGNPDFVRERLGGKKALAYTALDNVTQQKQAEAEIAKLEKEKEDAINAGTWTEPATPEQDEIAKTKQKLEGLQNDFKELASGKRYADMLKSGMVDVYAAKNPKLQYRFTTRPVFKDGALTYEVIPDSENGNAFVQHTAVDNFNNNLEEAKKQAIEKAQDVAQNKVSSWKQQVESINSLESAEVDDDFFKNLNNLLNQVSSYGMNPEIISPLVTTLSSRLAELEETEIAETSGMEVSPKGVAAGIAGKNIGNLYNQFNQLANYNPSSEFNEDEFLLNQYFPNREQINRYANATEDDRKVLLANPNIIKRGGEADIALDNLKKSLQIAYTNADVYNQLEDKYTGLNDSNRLTPAQFDMVKREAEKMEQMINKIREESTEAVNNRQREQLRINGIRVQMSQYMLDYAVKISEINNIPEVKSAIAQLNGAMNEMKNSDFNEDSVRKAEKAITVIQSFLHYKFQEDPKLINQIEEALITNKRKDTGRDITAVSILRPIEFLGANFEQIYNLDSLTGQGKNKDAFYQTFAAFEITRFFNLIRRVDMNDVVKSAHDVIKKEPAGSNTPSYEQVQSIIELTGFLINSDNDWISEYSKLRAKYHPSIKEEQIKAEIAKLLNNSIFFRGFAGVGKTTTVIPLALKVYMDLTGLKELSICHVGPNERIVNKLQAATKSVRGNTASGAFIMDDFINSSENITGAYNLTLIDEASLLSINDIQKIKLLQQSGNPIIFIGDQSQVSDELDGNLLPIEKMMERTTPMTASFRNASQDINNFANRARSGIFSETLMEFPNTDYNKDENFGIKYYKTEEDIVKAVLNDINNKNLPWLIVSDDNRRDELIERLVNLGVNLNIAEDVVKYIKRGDETAQGDERPKVYVAIRQQDVMKNGDVNVGMYNRMMMTSVTRAGGAGNNLGFAGILDESGKAKSKEGRPIQTSGFEIDRQALLSKLLNMHTPDLHGKKVEPAPATASTSSTTEDPEGVGKLPTAVQMKKALDKIKKGDKGVVDNMLKHFKPTKEQVDALRAAEQAYAKNAKDDDKETIADYAKNLTQLGWSDEDIRDFSLEDAKRIVELKITKIPEAKEDDTNESSFVQVDKKDRFISGALQYNTRKTLKINGYAIPYDGSPSQENVPLNKLQQAKLVNLRSRFGKTDMGTVVLKYHPTLDLMDDNGVHKASNVFALYSDDTDTAVFLGVMSMVDNNFDENSRGIDDIDYTNSREFLNLIKKIQNGYTQEQDPQLRQMLIDQHIKMAEIKYEAAKYANGVVVPVRRILSAQVVKPSDFKDTKTMPTLKDFFKKVNDRFGQNVVSFGVPFQMKNTDTGFVSYGMKVSFLGNPEAGITVRLRMDNMTGADINSILNNDGVVIPDSPDEDGSPFIGLKNAPYYLTYPELYQSRALRTIDYNRSILRQMIIDKNGVQNFLDVKENDRDIRVKGTDYKEQFQNLIRFYEFLKANEEIRQQLYVMPSIWHTAIEREYKSFNLNEIESISNRIFVEADKATPIHFPTIDIGTQVLEVSNKPTVYQVKENKKNKISGPPSFDDANDYEKPLIRPENTPVRQKITTQEAARQVEKLLGKNAIGIKFSPEVYSQNGKRLYAVARTGYIEFEDQGGVEKTAPRHEVLHQVMDFLLDPAYRNQLISAAKSIISLRDNKDISTITDSEAEEFIANQYGERENFIPPPALAPFYNLINNFLKFLKSLFINSRTYQDELNDFYDDIDYGKYYGQQFPSIKASDYEKPLAYDDEDEEADEQDDAPEKDNVTQKALKEKYGNLRDYMSLRNTFQTIEVADRFKPIVAQGLVYYLNPPVIMENNSLIQPKTIRESILALEKHYKDQAKQRVTKEFIEKVKEKGITGKNVLEHLDFQEIKSQWIYYVISKNDQVLRKYIQEIMRNVDVARLLETNNIQKSVKKANKVDTITKKENQLVDIADNRSDMLELLLNTVPAYTYAIENGVVVKKGYATGVVDPGLLKQALAEAGKQKADRNNFDKIYDNLVKMATSVVNNESGEQILTDRGNAIYSFLEKFGHTSSVYVSASDPTTWSYRYIAVNDDKIKKQWLGIEKDPLFQMHVNNARSITNALVNAFAHNKWVDPMIVELKSSYDEGANQRVTEFIPKPQKPTHVDKIKHKFKDGIDTTVFTMVGDDVTVNPRFINEIEGTYDFKRSADGKQVTISVGSKTILTLDLAKGSVNAKIGSKTTLDDLARALRIMGIKLDRKAANMFWTENPPLNETIQRNLDYRFTKQRLANITGTMLLASKTLIEKSYQESKLINGVLSTILTENGSTELDPSTSAIVGFPSPADYFRMVEQLAVAQSAAIGEKYKNRYFTVDGKTAYSIVPTDTAADDFGGGSINTDASNKKRNEAQQLIEQSVADGTIESLIRRNGNFFYKNGVVQIGNLVLTSDPDYHIHVGERYEMKGVQNNIKGSAYGKNATPKDYANMAIAPFLHAIKSNSPVQAIPIMSPPRADSIQAELHHFYMPVEKVVNKDGTMTAGGKKMIHDMIIRMFDNNYRETYASISRWQDYLRQKGIMLTNQDVLNYAANPYSFYEFFNAVISPKLNTVLKDIQPTIDQNKLEPLHYDVVHNNSGLYENKDYIVKKGKITLGFGTLFNSSVNDKGEIEHRDDIFNFENYSKLLQAQTYVNAATENYNSDPSEENMARLDESEKIYQRVFQNTYQTAYFDMVNVLKQLHYEIPSEVYHRGYATKNVPKEYTVAGIKFVESTSTDYRVRTKENAKADATIAIAYDFNTAGEKATKRFVNELGKKYIPIDLKKGVEITPELVNSIVKSLNDRNAKTLNIAGNGIANVPKGVSQQDIDNYVQQLIEAVLSSPDLKNKITQIYSGGQTGFDEAGAKVGAALGIPTTVNAPMGYKFRPGAKDVMDRDKFISRFGPVTELEDESKAELILNPFFESFFLLNTIIQNNFYEAQLGHMNQYKSIVDFFKRDKEGPGTGAETGSKAGLPATLRNVVIADFDGWHHNQLEKMYPELGDLSTVPTDGLQLMSPTTRMELLLAFGGDYSQIGNGQGKYNVRYYDIKEGVFKYIKSSTMHLTQDILDLASTFGANHLTNKNNYFEDTLRRMYSKELYDKLSEYRTMINPETGNVNTFEDATRMLLNDIHEDDAAPAELKKNYRAQINDFITFKSAYKSASKIINRGDLQFEQLVAEPLDSRYIRHQVTLDQEAENASASGPKQFFAVAGLLGHNKRISDAIDKAQIAKARSVFGTINEEINKMSGETPKIKFHNYLKQLGINSVNTMKDYGVIAQALTTKDVSLEPSLLRNKVLQSFVKQVSKALRFKSSGIRLVQVPGLFHVYDGTDGITYTLADIKRMTPDQANLLGLTDNPGRVLHPDRIDEQTKEMLPGEVIGTYIHKEDFGILDNESLHDAMSIHMLDGTFVRFDNMEYSDIEKFVNKNIKKIDAVNTPLLRAEDKESWINDLRKSLYGVSFRVPSHGPGSGQFTKTIGFIGDYSSVFFNNPVKNILNGSDYDADQISHFTFSRNEIEDNALLQSMVDYFEDPRNHRIINTPLSTASEERFADRLKENMYLQPNSLGTSIKMYKANNDGKQIIDRLAMAGKLYGMAYKAKMNNKFAKVKLPELFKGFNFEDNAQDNWGYFINDVTSKFLQLALDNAKLQVLGIIGANPESVNTMLGMMFATDITPSENPDVSNKFEEIADFFSRKHIRGVFEWAQNSKSIDDKSKKIWKIADVKIANLEKVVAGMDINEMVAIRKAEMAEKRNVKVLNDNEYTGAQENVNWDAEMEYELLSMYDDAQGQIDFVKAKIRDLRLLKQYDMMGEAFIRMNSFIRLDSKGIPTKDYDRYELLYGAHGIEFTLGMPLKEFFKDRGENFLKENPEWFMEKRKGLPKESTDFWRVTYDEEYEREKQIRALINYSSVLDSLPLIKEYVKIAKQVDDRITDSFIVGGRLYKNLMEMQLNNLNYDDWRSSQQFYLFTREFERLILSTYLNQSKYEFKGMTSQTATIDKPYNVRTTAGRSRYKREFIRWLDKYLKDNPALVEKNSFLRGINIASRGLKQYIEFPFKESLSPDQIVGIQQSAMDLKKTDKYKWENTIGGPEVAGIPISPGLSLYDGFVLYQLMQEDFSGGKMSFMDLLGASALTQASEFIKTKLEPSLENDSPLNLFNDGNKPIKKSFKDIGENIWLEDMVSRVKEILPWATADDLEKWKDGSGPKYFKMNKRRGEYWSEVVMTWTKEKGYMELFSTVANNNGYSIDKSTTDEAYEIVNDRIFEKQRIKEIPDEYMQNLLMFQPVTLQFPKPQTYFRGPVVLQENMKGVITNVSSDKMSVTVKLVNDEAQTLASINPTESNSNDGNTNQSKKNYITVVGTNNQSHNVQFLSKQEGLRRLVARSGDTLMSNIAEQFLNNPTVMNRLNRAGNILLYDPYYLETDIKARIDAENLTTGVLHSVDGTYNPITQNITINPTANSHARTLIHELVHNLTHDVIIAPNLSNPDEVRISDRMKMIYDGVKAYTEANNPELFKYQLSSVQEMVAHAFEHADFQVYLANIPSVLEKTNYWDNFVDTVMDMLNSIFKIPVDLIGKNALTDILAETMIYIQSPGFTFSEKVKSSQKFKEYYKQYKDWPEQLVYDYFVNCK